MRAMIVAGLVLILVTLGAVDPASGRLLEVTTSVPVEDVQREGELGEHLQTAVRGVVSETIAFTPTLVALTDARVVGRRLYLRLLIADEEGERELKDLIESAPEPDASKL